MTSEGPGASRREFAVFLGRSFGVVNMHLILCPAARMVMAWSMTCSAYALASCTLPAFRHLTTHRGSRSTLKQMPPRNWARCSTASRSRRGPLGPSISQCDPFGKYSSGSVSDIIS